MKDISFVRTEDSPVSAPPSSTIGPVAWMREHLFSGIGNTILTLIGLYLIYLVVPPLLNFAIFDAVYTGTDREACLAEGGGHVGACWPYVEAKFHQFIYGRYPEEERWRVDLVFAGFIIGLIPLLIPSVPYKRENAVYLFALYPLAALVLLTGGAFEYGSFLIAGYFLSGLTAFVIDFVILFGAIAGLVGWLSTSSDKDPMPGLVRVGIVAALVAAIFLIAGVDFGLETVETDVWGGLLVTLVVAIVGIAASFPIGVVLALGRRSDMPVVKFFSIIFIEFWRGIPLITVLFMSSVLLPLFLPEGVTFDKLLRALIGVTLFAAAYMAEVVRGGLQAIPKGQYEGAMAMGLRYWPMMRLIILPQALKLVIPGIVNTFIGLFKDTTLVLIIGLFDLLGIIQLTFTDPKWSTPVTSHTGYLFAAIFYWVCCFGMSRYSIYMEERLNTGHKR